MAEKKKADKAKKEVKLSDKRTISLTLGTEQLKRLNAYTSELISEGAKTASGGVVRKADDAIRYFIENLKG
jgi:hypothetical protein